MATLKNIFRFYIQASIHVSIAVMALAAITYVEFDLSPDGWVMGFIFLSTIAGYNFVKYAGVANNHHISVTPYIKVIRVFSIVAFVGVIFIALKLPANILYFSAFFGLMTLFYAIPAFKGRNIRMIRGVKIFIIAMVWAGVTVLLPLLNRVELFEPAVIIEFIARIAFVIALTIPFEIRDLKQDETELGTIPQQLGIKESRLLGSGLLLVLLILHFLNPVISEESLSHTGLIAIITLWAIWKAKEKQHEYYASFWVEGIPIVWYGLKLYSSI